jgi:hypothetical protein
MPIPKEQERLICPEGTYQAVCSGVWPIGVQKVVFSGVEKQLDQIYLRWELNALIDGGKYAGKRLTTFKKYTFSYHEKSSLRKDLKAWRGKDLTADEVHGFDLDNMLGMNCIIGIIHTEKNGNTYANISSIMATMPDMKPMVPELTPEAPEWVLDKRKQAIQEEPVVAEANESEVPF